MDFLAFLVVFCLLLITFVFVATLCENHLIPAVEILIRDYKIPEEVAAVTLVAMGSSSPEIVLNSVSVVSDASDLSLPAILGSAMIAFGFIPALCVILSRRDECRLHIRPILREVSFYSFGLGLFLQIIDDQVVELYEALMLLSVYILYVFCVVAVYLHGEYCVDKNFDLEDNMGNSPRTASPVRDIEMLSLDEDDDDDDDADDSAGSPEGVSKIGLGGGHEEDGRDEGNDDDDDVAEDVSLLAATSVSGKLGSLAMSSSSSSTSAANGLARRPSGSSHSSTSSSKGTGSKIWRSTAMVWGMWVTSTVTSFSEKVLYLLVPGLVIGAAQSLQFSQMTVSEQRQHPVRVSVGRVALTLATCIFYIGILASLIVTLCGVLVGLVGVDSATVGATVVALGSEIPDTISSVALARRGYFDGATAGAIGSQVINISVGVGFPALLNCLWHNRNSYKISTEEKESLWLLVTLVYIVIGGYVLALLPVSQIIACKFSSRTTFTRYGAMSLLCLWVTVYGTFIYKNET